MAEKTEKYTFQVMRGMHCGKKGKVYTQGQRFKTSDPLHKMFPNKFQIVGDGKVDDDDLDANSNSLLTMDWAAMKDVTGDFPTATKNDLLVFQGGDGYHVTENIEESEMVPLNPAPLSSKAKVNEFLKAHLKGE